ncbi:MAG: hypothetical protein M1376_02510 [Planctomycetes bacterium]|nr:hypothetical protein [Planctomycetota bacterium]
MRGRIGFFLGVLTILGTAAQGQVFLEGWERAAVGTYAPGSAIDGDEGFWFVGDAISLDPNCGPSPQKAQILSDNDNHVLQLDSVESLSGCSDIVFVALTEIAGTNAGFSIPLTPDTILTFNEVGELTNPQVHSPGQNCLLPPCFDNVSLLLSDSNGNLLAYVLQRFPGAAANLPNANFGDTYREIFLNPNAGSYRRNVFTDFLTIPAFDPTGAQITFVEFRVDQHGTAMIDDIAIGSQAPAGTEPVFRFFSPVFDCHFFTANEAEAFKLVNNFPDIWEFENVAFYALPEASVTGALPVYRFFSPVLASHFYTISEGEKNKLINQFSDIWIFEGIAFFAFAADVRPPETVPAFRFLNNRSGCHFYTTNEAERDKLINHFPDIWIFEGIAWYAYPP